MKTLPTFPASATRPQAASLIEKIPHLRTHIPKTGWGAEDEGIGVYEIFELDNRYVGESLPLLLGATLYQNFLSYQLWYLKELHLHAWHGART